MPSYGGKIKAAREAAGMTQEQLGKALGVTGVTIMRYEKEQRQIRLGQLGRIAKALNTTVYEMIGDDWSGIDTSDAFGPEDELAAETQFQEHPDKGYDVSKQLNDLTDIEQVHIKMYRSLDHYGQIAVDGLLETEYNRCMEALEEEKMA